MEGIAVDSSFNVYVADSQYNRIRKIDPRTGIVTHFAGSPAGTAGATGESVCATLATLRTPKGLAADLGGTLYIADSGNNVVRMVKDGVISTVAGGGKTTEGENVSPLTIALTSPSAIAVDHSGDLYIIDVHRVRKVKSPGTTDAKISTIVGSSTAGTVGSDGDNGLAVSAKLSSPTAITVDHQGVVYIADYAGKRVRSISLSGLISLYAGGGPTNVQPGSIVLNSNPLPAGTTQSNAVLPADAVQLAATDLAVDRVGNLFIIGANRLMMVDPKKTVTTLAGDGTADPYVEDPVLAAYGTSRISGGRSVALDPDGNIYLCDNGHYRVRVVNGLQNMPGYGLSLSPSPDDKQLQKQKPGLPIPLGYPGVRLMNSGAEYKTKVNITVAIPPDSALKFVPEAGAKYQVTVYPDSGVTTPAPYAILSGSGLEITLRNLELTLAQQETVTLWVAVYASDKAPTPENVNLSFTVTDTATGYSMTAKSNMLTVVGPDPVV
ncbi:hypothetical protein [Streptomyces sp. NPDC092307]|uniref:NHL domain-containing protein n=1 Tax=Streptomyces sp. NPDC092307 TaxID=3366013 RepID=UPI00380D8A8F